MSERRARISAGLPTPGMIDRLPPISIEAEQGLLGSILLDPKAVFEESIEDRVIEDYFYDLRHRTIFEAMKILNDNTKPVDLITMTEVLKSNNQLEPCGGATYLSALMDATPSAANAKYYIEILEEKYALRRIISMCTVMISDAYEAEKGKPQVVIDKVSKSISELAIQFNGQKITDMKALVHECIEDYERFSQGNVPGIGTGFIDYDRLTGGLKPSEYVVIAARPSMGKTSLAMNIVEHIALDENCPIGVFSLEMTSKSLVDRMIMSRARVNRRNLVDGFLADRDYPKICGAAGKISTAPIYIDDTAGLNVLQIRARAKKMFLEHGIKLLVIDFLQLISSASNRYENRDTEISRMSGGIKSLLKELNIPGIVLSQLNRDIEKDKARKPRLSDLRESGSIEQDADTIGMLYRPATEDDEEEDKSAYPVNWCIRKQRNGPTGEVPLTFFSSFTRFESAAKILF